MKSLLIVVVGLLLVSPLIDLYNIVTERHQKDGVVIDKAYVPSGSYMQPIGFGAVLGKELYNITIEVEGKDIKPTVSKSTFDAYNVGDKINVVHDGYLRTPFNYFEFYKKSLYFRETKNFNPPEHRRVFYFYIKIIICLPSLKLRRGIKFCN